MLVVITFGGYFFGTRKEYNVVTGEDQRIAYSVKEEIALGLQAAPEMEQQFGGLYRDDCGRVPQRGAGGVDSLRPGLGLSLDVGVDCHGYRGLHPPAHITQYSSGSITVV